MTPRTALVIALTTAGLAGVARADAPRTVAAQLDLAAGREALARLPVQPELRSVLDDAVRDLVADGATGDARALLGDVAKAQSTQAGLLAVGYARVGDRSHADQLAATFDKNQGRPGGGAPALACDLALAYEIVGDQVAADARLARAHGDCPGYLAAEDLRTGHRPRALALLDHAPAPTSASALGARAAARASAGAADARAAIADAAAKVAADKPDDATWVYADLARAAAARGWRADARGLYDRAIASVTDDELFDDSERTSLAIAIGDKALARTLAGAAAARLATGAGQNEVLEVALDWALAGDRGKARALLVRALTRAPDRAAPTSATERAAEDARDAATAAAPTGFFGRRGTDVDLPPARLLVRIYLALGDLPLAIRAASQDHGADADTLAQLAAYAHAHKIAASKALTAALATLQPADAGDGHP